MGKRLQAVTARGRFIGALDFIDRRPGADAEVRQHLQLAERVAREHAALCSYLRDAELDAGREEIAAQWDRQGLIAATNIEPLRALWAGEMGLPLTLAQTLLQTLQRLVDQMQSYEPSHPPRHADTKQMPRETDPGAFTVVVGTTKAAYDSRLPQTPGTPRATAAGSPSSGTG